MGRANQTKGPAKKETRTCHYCGKVGHLQKDCSKKKRDEASKASSLQSKPEGNVMSLSSSTLNATKGTACRMLLDSGATHHVVCDEAVLQNIRNSSVSQVVLGGGEEHRVISEGDFKVKGGPR
jgi:hypothetical protein